MSNESSSTTDWDQQAFDRSDRRRARSARATGSEKAHDILHLAGHPTQAEALHALVREHSRHTDALHAHEGGLVVTCAQGDAAGLRNKLVSHIESSGLSAAVVHGTFPAGSQLTENLRILRGR